MNNNNKYCKNSYKEPENYPNPDMGAILNNDVVSNTECTGMVQTLEIEATEGLSDIYEIPEQAGIKFLKEELSGKRRK